MSDRVRPRLIAIDIDGTLLGLDGKVSARNLAAMQAARDAGIEVVVATGRRHSYAMRVLRGLKFPEDDVLVTSNGTVVRTVGARLIERTFLPHETAMWLCSHLDGFRNAMVITFDMVQSDGDDAKGALVVEEFEGLHGSIEKWMIANAPYIERVVPIEDALRARELAGEAPIQMMLCGGIERMRRAEARLLENAGVFSVGVTAPELFASAKVTLSRTEYPERDLSLVDILPAGCSKGAALRRVAALQGITMNEMMAIGDNWNDVSMLEVAGWPVVMENAPDDLKELALLSGWTLGGHHLRDGVAEAIEAALAMPLTPIVEQEEQVLSGSLRA